MKPWHKLLLLIAALLLCLATAACFGSEGDNTAELTDTALDEALTAYLAQEQDSYTKGSASPLPTPFSPLRRPTPAARSSP